jgi:deoxyribodipyrimidine photo-lyase
MTESIFIFRRDLRSYDNTGLIKACKESSKVYPIFIINPIQVSEKNSYKSENSIYFMHESLIELDNLIDNNLSFFHGDNTQVIDELIKNEHMKDVKKVYSNMDYTPYARKRDDELKKTLEKHNIEFVLIEDYTLTPLDAVKTDSGTPYTKFTPYKNKAKQIPVHKPVSFSNEMMNKLSSITLKNLKHLCELDILEKYYTPNKNVNVHGGRSLGLKIIKKSKNFDQYAENRNTLTYKTTFLSAYIKFGCVSLREIYHGFQKNISHTSPFFDELYWHDFYAQAIYHNPKVLEGKSMDKRFDQIEWNCEKDHFTKWCNGETGFPVVDAAMNQLNTTGFMHNRARMIVASFLVKTLLCDWRWGEKYFAQKLVDYDPSSNVGGWLWTAGGGFDSQPYFRIFNPWTQSEKFDPNAEYIKEWLPELKDVSPKDIHTWNQSHSKYNLKYSKPIVDYSVNRTKALDLYKKYL